MTNVNFSDVSSLIVDGGQVKSLSIDGVEMWNEPVEIDYLCFTAEEANSTIKLVKTGTPTGDDFQYSTDKKNWTKYSDWGNETITLTNVEDKVYFKGNNPDGISANYNATVKFAMTGKIAASGNIMTLIDGTGDTKTVPNSSSYYSMFQNCTSLTTAPELPATTLADYCYNNMFLGCTSLATAPALPATILMNYCYYNMFANCTSLAKIPELPATTLANACYYGMFQGCSKIKISETQSEEYPNKYEFGATPTSNADFMFNSTGGTFTGTPTQRVYYTANEIIHANN